MFAPSFCTLLFAGVSIPRRGLGMTKGGKEGGMSIVPHGSIYITRENRLVVKITISPLRGRLAASFFLSFEPF